MKIVTRETVADKLRWADIIDALFEGHQKRQAEIGDQLLSRGPDALLSRAAWIDGLGFGVKSVSVMANNVAAGLPTVQGGMLVFDDTTGALEAILDSDLVTEWKTAGDSALGAKLLARRDSASYLILGAGVVAESLAHAFSQTFPSLRRIEIWNRTPGKAKSLAEKLAKDGLPVSAVTDLPAACTRANIISTATMAKEPILLGEWVGDGTHVDLIGAFKKDMREADNELLQKGRLFVDSFETTLDHIGELMIPLAEGAIARDAVLADLYGLVAGSFGRDTEDEITVFKNGGGAHLDLMTAKRILQSAD
ncbi:MAG: ornithine cyclodeaminase [Rhizobiales bacterium]|nr:ornithine cyclodeaminase [Hyphomicrobiales bacterium]MBO6698552.1 ornithine cyclodeaminase [Hyphomicrobiales bacterium]MBO6735194.1 ornithine cyclodeaminase [Hyphomicrobiales bacterium]MBO6910998.1 ornithine cyclodeaminase [Hyphomicrobiales bacterium]MBO6957209.1 ornithine cyclodeaminase [Hyphomicrobiales bacterium]